MNDEAWPVRIHAAEAVWRVGSEAKAVVPALVQELTNEVARARYQAATVLGRMGSEGKYAVSVLNELATNDEHAFVRKAAAQAIKEIKPVGF
jgi:HEAT repeat protein